MDPDVATASLTTGTQSGGVRGTQGASGSGMALSSLKGFFPQQMEEIVQRVVVQIQVVNPKGVEPPRSK